MVVNSRNEILCVRELRRNFMPWKIPGGLSDLGEGIDTAVIREVLEETGNFQSVLAFRHTHNLQFGRSDLYFVCRLTPVEGKDKYGNVVIPEPVPEAGEIEKTAWLPFDEYKAMVKGQDGGTGHPVMQHVLRVFEAENDVQKVMIDSIVPGRKPSPVYMVKPNDNE